MKNSNSFLLDLREIDKTKFTIAGGKGVGLGELSSIEGVRVPGGFCITTEAYKEIIGANEKINSLLGQLAILKALMRKKTHHVAHH